MSGSASISGLSSGLDTASIIEQLMQLEAVPQTRLKSRLTTEKSVLTTLQALNTKVAALATSAADLLKPAAWNAVTATSSEAKVAVSAASTAGPGSFSVRVDRTALSHRLEMASAVGASAAGTVPATVRLDRLDGTPAVDLATDGTLNGLARAINDPANATGLRATAVKVGPDQYRLVVESAATGAAGDFTLTDAADGSDLLGGATVRAGRDAQVTIGDSVVATSSSNTFADLVPGVTVTLAGDTAGGTTSQVVLARDPAATTAAVKALVTAVNSILSDIDTQSRTGSGTRGPLAGDTGIRSVRDQLLNSVFPGDGTSLSDLGIQTDRSGRLVLDEATLRKAYDTDPTALQARLTTPGTGFVDRVRAAAATASDRVNGTLTTAITGRTATIDRLDDGVEAWDLRLELRRNALTRQYTSLETALNQMSSQSSWLAGQLSSLTTSGS